MTLGKGWGRLPDGRGSVMRSRSPLGSSRDRQGAVLRPRQAHTKSALRFRRKFPRILEADWTIPSQSSRRMNLKQFQNSPALVRVVPFAIFLALTFCQSYFGETGRYWFYLAKTLVGAWLIWAARPFIAEMRWQISWQALAVG